MSGETVPVEAVDLMGQIVAANVAQAAATTDSLLEFKDSEIRRLATALVRLGEILDNATVIDRKTERALSYHSGWFTIAEDILERMSSST